MKKKKLLGISSIIIGTIVSICILFVWLFVDFFSNNGLISSLGVFIYFLILILAGILLLTKSKYAIISYWSFSFGVVIERIVSLFIFKLSWIEIAIPLLLSLPFIIAMVRNRSEINKKGIYVAIVISIFLNFCLVHIYMKYPNMII